MHFGPHNPDEDLVKGIRAAIGVKEDPHFKAGCIALLWAATVVPVVFVKIWNELQRAELTTVAALVSGFLAFFALMFAIPAIVASPFALISTMLRPHQNWDEFAEAFRFAVAVGAIRIHILLTGLALAFLAFFVVYLAYGVGGVVLEACWRLLFF